MVFHWRLSDNKSLQVSGTLLSILADLNNVVIWLVSTRPPTSKSSSPFNNPSITEPRAPITIFISSTFMFQQFFQFPSKIKVFVLSPNYVSILLYGHPGQQSLQFGKFSSFWLLL